MTLYMSGMLHVCHNIFLGFTERLTIALKFTFSKQALWNSCFSKTHLFKLLIQTKTMEMEGFSLAEFPKTKPFEY